MPELTHLSLFSGIGGLDLAAEWAGFKTVGQCEWADYPRAVLEKHWPGLPRWRDIRTLTKESFYEQTGLWTVTVLSGGFPCQPFSTAGKRRGKEDDRYLWPEMLRVISEIRPRWVIGENVAGIVTMALDTVLSDLESIGYTCQAIVIPACAVDAPHRRDRVVILGYSNDPGNRTSGHGSEKWSPASQKRKYAQYWSCGSGTNVSNTDSTRLQGRKQHGAPDQGWQTKPHRSAGECSAVMADTHTDGCARIGIQSPERCDGNKEHPTFAESCYVSNTDNQRIQIRGYEPGFQEISTENGIELSGWWPAEPDVGRVAHGVPARVDRLKCLGNAVVPQWAYPFFEAIAKIEMEEMHA